MAAGIEYKLEIMGVGVFLLKIQFDFSKQKCTLDNQSESEWKYMINMILTQAWTIYF